MIKRMILFPIETKQTDIQTNKINGSYILSHYGYNMTRFEHISANFLFGSTVVACFVKNNKPVFQWFVEQDSFTETKTNIKRFEERSVTKRVLATIVSPPRPG